MSVFGKGKGDFYSRGKESIQLEPMEITPALITAACALSAFG